MTGREKILEAINLIDLHLQQSFSGDTVQLSSMDFDVAGLRLEEQFEILDALKDDYECIDYTYELPHKDWEWEDVVKNVASTFTLEPWMKGIHESYIVGKILSERSYSIRVLSSFKDVKVRTRHDQLEKYAYHETSLSNNAKIIPSNNYQILYVSLDKRSNNVVVGLRPGDRYTLGKPLRFDSPPYNFMNYILKNHDRPISIHEIQENVQGCKTKNDLSELVRACHFDKDMKRVFFERTTQKTVRFTPWKQIDGEQLEWFKNWMEQNRESIV